MTYAVIIGFFLLSTVHTPEPACASVKSAAKMRTSLSSPALIPPLTCTISIAPRITTPNAYAAHLLHNPMSNNTAPTTSTIPTRTPTNPGSPNPEKNPMVPLMFISFGIPW